MTPAAVTGERVTTRKGGFNPTWQRHVAAYRSAAPLFGPGRVLDLGCGIGHSYELLAPRETVGLDRDATALAGQQRVTVLADMRSLPFPPASFASVLSVHSIEHVPDAGVVVAEVVRVLEPGGTAVFVTPNRFTFARPDEIIDPYHYVEYGPDELADLLGSCFAHVEIHGLFGSPRYVELVAEQKVKLDRLLALDPLRVRRLVPRRVLQRLYDSRLTRERAVDDPRTELITPDDFELGSERIAQDALDLVAVCR
ncbi:MAG TPA: class I SAM-dependent methyltransferase [Solirubrobacteraceae bacterium]|nr:class I SAM-dependent methyltransferase [Solirubrobacteraceae bacterium]